jgi:ferric-dicitrate binding protein FerR (iron transport regulator)
MENKNYEPVHRLIASYLTGNASEKDLHELETWVLESDENRKYYHQFKNLWDASSEINVSSEEALQNVMRRIKIRQQRVLLWNFVQKAAAVLFIPLLLSVFWLNYHSTPAEQVSQIKYNKAVAAFGTFSLIELPDGSKVWLNSGSNLRYPVQFDENKRNVYLEGEAFFEVHSNKAKPFLVHTPYFSVKATGTRFTVRADKNFRIPSVTLIEGKVAIEKPGTSNEGKPMASLLPNQHFTFDTLNKNITIQTEDTYKYYAWKDGKLVFRNDNISEVARRISIQYNVDIEIKGDKIRQYRYRATFVNEPLGELLRLLKISSPIDYVEIKQKELPDGSFTRRKIIIYSAAD